MPGLSSGEGNVEVWSKATGEWNGLPITIGAGGSYLADFKLHAPPIDIQNGDLAFVWYMTPIKTGSATCSTPPTCVRANQSHDWVQGEATPQTIVKVKVMRERYGDRLRRILHRGGNGWNVNPRQPDGAMWTCAQATSWR